MVEGGAADIIGDGAAHFEQAPIAIAILDLHFRFVRSNKFFHALAGRTGAELQALRLQDVTHPEDVAGESLALAEGMAGATELTVQKRYVRPDGSVVWACDTISAVLDSSGHLRSLVVIAQPRPAAFNREQGISALLAGAQDCVNILDAEGNLLQMNAKWLDLLGIDDPVSYLGVGWTDLWQGNERAIATNAVQRAQNGGVGHFEGFLETVEHAPKWWDVLVTPIFGPDGKAERLLCILRDITERKQDEAEFADARQRAAALLFAGEVGTWTHDIQANRVTADKNLAELFEISADDAAGGRIESILRAIHPDDRNRVESVIATALESGKPFEVEYRVLHSNGSVRTVIARGEVERDGNGRPARLPGVVVDITDRVRAEQARRRLTAELNQHSRVVEAFLSSIADFAYTFDRGGRFVYANKALLDLWGLRLEDAVGRNFFDLHYPDDLAARLQRQIQHVFDTRLPLSDRAEYTSPTGVEGYYEYIFTPVVAVDGSVPLVAGTTRNITEQNDVFEALRESEARFRQLADAMPQIVWAAQPDGTLDYYNRRWYEYIDLPSAASDDARWDRYIHPEDLQRAYAAWALVLATGMPYGVEFRVRRADGEYRWFLVRALPIHDTQNRVTRWFGTCTDIEDQRRLLAQNEYLLQSERAARSVAEHASLMKDEFLATLSHELRTPLSAILGWSQVMRMRPNSGPDLQRGLEAIERNARAQTQLIEDLLDMSRVISGKLRLDITPLQPNALIEAAIETVMPAAVAKSIAIERDLQPTDELFHGDQDRLQQVLWNLLSNAIKFTPAGGSVRIALRSTSTGVQISVADTGQGIAANFLPHVFDRFRQADSSMTRKHGGLGLGLAIVKELVGLHGGTVRVESRGENQGSVFTVELPLSPPQVPAVADPSPQNALRETPAQPGFADLAGLTILVVDDDPDGRELIKRVLDDCGARLLTAASAAEGLAAIEAEAPDLLVSDIGMAGMDGYEFLRRVRAADRSNGAEFPAIALSAFARPEDKARALAAGYAAHVSKPANPSQLVGTIAAVTGRSAAGFQ